MKICTIEICTVREKSLVNNWLKENNLLQFISEVTDIKNKFLGVILDDRAVNFNGDFNKACYEITNFLLPRKPVLSFQ